MDCTFDSSDTAHFPFKFHYANGSVEKNGTMTNGVCVFDVGYKCGDLKGRSCCELTSEVESASQMWFVPLICFFVPYVVMQLLRRYRQQKAVSGDEGSNVTTDGSQRNPNIMAVMWAGKSKAYKIILGVTFMASICAIVAEQQIMPQSIQQNLTPADRSAQLTISVFLTPVAEVFAFIEDTMAVKVGYAMALGQYERLNLLLHISILGGLLSAVVAFVAMLGLALDDDSAGAILNPFEDSNNILIARGCELIPTTGELLGNARVYWILMTAAWIPSFAVKGLSGFLVGTGELAVYLFPLILSATVPITLWFALLAAHDAGTISLKPVAILGIAYGVGPWLLALFLAAFLASRRDIQKKFALRLLCRRDNAAATAAASAAASAADDNGAEEDSRVGGGVGGGDAVRPLEVLREITSEGAQLMVVDLAVQLSKTITIYVASTQGFHEVYKLASADAAYWTFGPAYIVGMYTILKIMGAQLIARGQHHAFLGFFVFLFVITLSLGVGAVATAYIKQGPVAFLFGESACVYATSEGCSPVYARIFNGSNGLHSVFAAFGPTVLLNMLFGILRQGLATCHDFSFLAKASTAAFVIVFPPSLLVARLVLNSAAGYWLAMYMPHFALVVIFGFRMAANLRRLKDGEEGPWTQHAARTYVDTTATARDSVSDTLVGQAAAAEGGSAYRLLNERETRIV